MGVNHEVNASKIFLDDDGAALVSKPKQAFRLTRNDFKELLQKL